MMTMRDKNLEAVTQTLNDEAMQVKRELKELTSREDKPERDICYLEGKAAGLDEALFQLSYGMPRFYDLMGTSSLETGEAKYQYELIECLRDKIKMNMANSELDNSASRAYTVVLAMIDNLLRRGV